MFDAFKSQLLLGATHYHLDVPSFIRNKANQEDRDIRLKIKYALPVYIFSNILYTSLSKYTFNYINKLYVTKNIVKDVIQVSKYA